ncbi:hypothetical protein [Chryseobacterium shigense]|uniref:Uncharacterized protein n=1 Tax=Chryseobacterium shigense TaxID=297244 RepID=A0A841NCY4_9FLAO|nr:hypothetical protein [Chryseobacterium shigense]MBB6371190.1 hypothetical protein [Chryseobacterium shigense]
MINFILVLIGFLSSGSMNKEQNNTISHRPQNIVGSFENNEGGPVGGNSGQTPPPFTQP